MKTASFAALALACASPLFAQSATSTAATVDFGKAVPIPGDWTYAPRAGGSEAVFKTSAGSPQLTIRCTRATRRVSLSKPATGAAPFLSVWTSSLPRSLPASFQPATAQLVAEVGANDGILDAMAFSRGRIGVSATGQPPLIVPAWEEIARVVEDCRT